MSKNTKWQDAVKDIVQQCRDNEKFGLMTTFTPDASGALANLLEILATLCDNSENASKPDSKE